jgi:hypothetical protein
MFKQITLLAVLMVCVTVIFAGAQTNAHSTGATIETVVGEYLVDIGYTPENIVTGSPARFDLLLFSDESGQEVEFTDVWVRVEKDSILWFAGGIDQPIFGSAGFSYTFSESGEYTLSVRYHDERKVLIETEVSVMVEKKLEPFLARSISWLTVIGIVALSSMGAMVFGFLSGVPMTSGWLRLLVRVFTSFLLLSAIAALTFSFMQWWLR